MRRFFAAEGSGSVTPIEAESWRELA
jgi:hypothetical protein